LPGVAVFVFEQLCAFANTRNAIFSLYNDNLVFIFIHLQSSRFGTKSAIYLETL
jgi:hypothetical protein